METLLNFFISAWSIFLVVIFFGGSIFVHELGHFLAARRRGLTVLRFSIGFGPKIFSWKGKDGVEYRLAWLPLGGYVAIPQIADMRTIEGAPSADAKPLPEPSYTSKVIVFAAGAVFNVIFAVVLSFIVWGVGVPTSTEQTSTVIGEIPAQVEGKDGQFFTSPALKAGLKVGDKIVAIDGRKMNTFGDVTEAIMIGSGRVDETQRLAIFTIERDGRMMDFPVNPVLSGDEQNRKIGIANSYEVIVSAVKADTVADKAGFKEKDVLLSLDGIEMNSRQMGYAYLNKHREAPISAVVRRGTETATLIIPPATAEELKLAAESKEPIKILTNVGFVLSPEVWTIYPNPFVQIWDNATRLYRTFSSLVNRHSDVGISKLSGPPGIARVYYMAAQSDFRYVLWFTIVVNINLALMNLLPIPVLDGGHILFATIARIRKRALPLNLIEGIQYTFMALLFSMIFYVSFFDVRRWVRESSAPSERATPTAPAKAVEPTPILAPAKDIVPAPAPTAAPAN